MESQNHKIIKGFVSEDEKEGVLAWANKISHVQNTENHHIKEIGKELLGNSHMFDLSKSPISGIFTQMQSGNDVVNEEVPSIIKDIADRIKDSLGIPADHLFMQCVDMRSGGKIGAHYDIGISGHIVYKCNISVLSEDYNFYVDKDTMEISEGDLYCFEASLYKHWTDRFNGRRVLLSYGFVLPYDVLGRSEEDHRVRLSKRIEKYIQHKH